MSHGILLYHDDSGDDDDDDDDNCDGDQSCTRLLESVFYWTWTCK